MKAIKNTIYYLTFLLVLFSCSSDDEGNENGIPLEPDTVTFLNVTKQVIGGCTIQTFDDDLGILCSFTIVYEIEGGNVTVSATVPGSCNQELNDVFQISDDFFGDHIRFSASVIRFDGTDPDVYFGQSGTVTVINNDTETSFSFDGVLYDISASNVTETIVGSAVCPI